MIRQAVQEDLQTVIQIVKDAVKIMNEQGNYQWHEDYPAISDYQGDLDKQELYVYGLDGQVAGAATISKTGHEEYPSVSWTLPDPALVIKRVVVSPHARKAGIANALFQYAEKIAKEQGIFYLKTDTFEKNEAAQKLFKRMGFHFIGTREVNEKNGSLCYYEKILK
ncbi:GNAT family N-acetyltransferase [Bacillaceae bacterium Marseille-Q3522]|nr:GNAT family N-acetyltransferase [Bacillaceae bacterium Marseille-Q3522]